MSGESVTPLAGTTTNAAQYDRLADAIGLRYWETVALCHQLPGGRFTSKLLNVGAVPHAAAALPPTADVWCSVNPVNPANVTGRGKITDVARWAAMVADLDIAPSKCPDEDAAWAIIAELSTLAGQRPAAVVHSGHGLHPYWPLDGVNIGDGDHPWGFADTPLPEVVAKAKSWAALVARVGKAHNAPGIDASVSGDLARVLRVPGTWNNKAEPVLARLVSAEEWSL